MNRVAARIARTGVERPRNDSAPTVQRRRRPWGEMANAIATVLNSGGEMRPFEIRVAVEALLGEPVSPSSVKSCLAFNSGVRSRRFERVGRGLYRLAGSAVD